MSVRSLNSVALVVALAAFAGCSGGAAGSAGEATFSCTGAGARAMCLQSCNLGCSSTGCARTDIAQNETIILQFSDAIDPASVGPSSIRFRTASGAEPVGEFFVNGNQVEFVPTLSISGGQTFFGFTSGETYTMTLIGGQGQASAVRSTTGKLLERTLTCTIRSTLGIVDVNQVPPSATLIVPSASQITAAARDTDIVLEFNELIDATPFVSGTQSPVTFSVRRTREALGGGFECDPASAPQVLSGTQRLDFDAGRGVSILTFNPSIDLPGNVCVQVGVTSGVSDLSGRPAQPQQFTFRTIVVPLVEQPITEEFDNNQFFDEDASAGAWAGGQLTFASIGGDARHGPFSLTWCTDTGTFVEGRRLYRLNTDLVTIPGANTTTGSPIAITDGRFFLSDFVLPSNAQLEFTGSRPPQFTVAGKIDILGVLSVAGSSIAAMPSSTATLGQSGGAAGVFGGIGGKGGDRINVATGVGTVNPGIFQGANGGAAQLPAQHAYLLTAAGTGGAGSTVFPASGLGTALQFPPQSTPPVALQYCVSASAGGGGGAHWLAGSLGRVVSNNAVTPPPGLLSAMGPDAAGGTALQLFPVPAGVDSSLHFLVGGGGGGGGASQGTMCLSVSRNFAPGAGGGGGGGAIALRAGDSLRVGPAGRVLANGGSAASTTGTTGSGPQPCPGGGGAGGSIVLQTGRAFEISGLVDVRGGAGGSFSRSAGTAPFLPPGGAVVVIQGGNGGNGFVRLEAPATPALTALATMQPAPASSNVGQLSEVDDLVAVRSRFYSTNTQLGPEYARYEVYATVGGVPIVYSDDPAFGVPAGVGAAVRALFQAARLDLGTNEVLETGPWRTSVRSVGQQIGIASDALNGFRFMLYRDATINSDVTIQRVVVVYRI